jgi:hypothetical protein
MAEAGERKIYEAMINCRLGDGGELFNEAES